MTIKRALVDRPVEPPLGLPHNWARLYGITTGSHTYCRRLEIAVLSSRLWCSNSDTGRQVYRALLSSSLLAAAAVRQAFSTAPLSGWLATSLFDGFVFFPAKFHPPCQDMTHK